MGFECRGGVATDGSARTKAARAGTAALLHCTPVTGQRLPLTWCHSSPRPRSHRRIVYPKKNLKSGPPSPGRLDDAGMAGRAPPAPRPSVPDELVGSQLRRRVLSRPSTLAEVSEANRDGLVI